MYQYLPAGPTIAFGNPASAALVFHSTAFSYSSRSWCTSQNQGPTLVHSSAQCKGFLWDRGCI